MTTFLEGVRLRPISESRFHVPLGQTRKIALKGYLDSRDGELAIELNPAGVCKLISSAIQRDMRVLTLRGQLFGEARLTARSKGGSLKDYVDLHVHRPRTRQLPEFSQLMQKYAGDEETSDDFRIRIGARADDQSLANTCVLRVTEAFSESGHRIPSGRADLKTIRSKNGKTLALRVAEFKRYLVKEYGPPDIVAGISPPRIAGVATDLFEGLAGVMCFEAKFSNATGHFTLWDGSRAVHGDYFDRSYLVSLWIAG